MELDVLECAARQGGLVTAAQAQLLGASRMQLSRMESSGHLERLAQGVYRSTAAPRDRFEHIRVAWMSMEPRTFLEDRAFTPSEGVVVAGAAAAALHEMGDLYDGEVSLLVPSARRTRREGIALRARRVSPADVVVVEGLPALSATATIADLVELRYDRDQVAEALADAATGEVDFERLQALLEPLSRRNGCRDGEELLEQLLQLAGLDVDSLLRQAASSEALPLVMQQVLSEAVSGALETMSGQWESALGEVAIQQMVQDQQMLLKSMSDQVDRVVNQEAMTNLAAALEVLAARTRPLLSAAALEVLAARTRPLLSATALEAMTKQVPAARPVSRGDNRVDHVHGADSGA